MKNSKILMAITGLAMIVAAAPVNAQNTNLLNDNSELDDAGRTPAQVQKVAIEIQKEMLESVKRIAGIKIEPAEFEAPYRGSIGVINPVNDSWKSVTQAKMLAATEDPYFRIPNYSLEVAVDYDKDGKPDIARMYNNSKQGAIIVTYATGRSEVIYKQDEPFSNAIQIFPAGKTRILLSFPETSQAILEKIDGKPMIYYMGE